MGVIIAVANQKGGVGKSTTVVNLGTALAMKGERVLLLDIDPQGNTTSGLGIEKSSLTLCMYDLLLNELPIEEIAKPTLVDRLRIIPATLRLAGAEIELVSAFSRETRLKKALEEVREEYDYILIDCPPSLGLLTINSLTASDAVLIPIQCEYYALEGLTQLLEVIQLVQRHLNTSLKIYGALLTMFDPRTNLSAQVATEVRNFFKKKAFKTIIPRNIKLSEAPSFGRPVLHYDIRSRGAEAYMELAEELMKRPLESVKGGDEPFLVPVAGRKEEAVE